MDSINIDEGFKLALGYPDGRYVDIPAPVFEEALLLLNQGTQQLQTTVATLQQENIRLKSGLEVLRKVILEEKDKNTRLMNLNKKHKKEIKKLKQNCPVPVELPETSSWSDVLPDHMRCVIIGAPGSGKSATGHFLLDYLHTEENLKAYMVGFPASVQYLLPEWAKLASSFREVPSGAVILHDEAYLDSHARKRGFDKQAKELVTELGLSRQLGHDLIFIAHETRHLDKNIVGYCNLFIIKYPGIMSVKFERPELRELVAPAQAFFETVPAEDRQKYAYVLSPEKNYEGPMSTSLPSHWTEELSQAYGISQSIGSMTREGLVPLARKLKARGLSYREIGDALSRSKSTVYGWLKSLC